ncbi:MAG TPA: SapC family protein [Cellvibrionaceae bacterium]
MTNHVLLNNISHHDLKVDTRYSEEFGDNVNLVLTFPTEFADIQREYPIFFQKNQKTGQFQSVALLGFEKGENLFLGDGQWQASYVPGIIARGPFLIGFQEQEVDGELQKEPVIHVDMDNPRVNKDQGRAVFLEHGGNTPYLEQIANILKGIHLGMAANQAMFAAFEALELIEPVSVQVQLNEGKQYDLQGYYTISEEKLANLDAESLFKLNRSGFLQGAYLVVASLSNVKKLIDMKNRKLMMAQTTA